MVSSPFPAGQAAASGTRGGGEAATTTWQLDLPNEAATQRLAEVLCEELKAGDLVTLSGDLGAGKTTFARSLIRTLAGDAGLEVPSPTFTLMQLYDTARPPVVHADFYRLGGAEELTDLGWEEACEGALVLVEWPQKAEEALSPDRLDIAFHLLPHEHPGRRRVVMTGHGRFAPRLFRLRAIRTLLDAAGWGDAERRHIQGDASYREYERLTRPDGATAVLMISPPRPPGPVLRGTKPYPIAAKLALTVHPFVAVDKGLRALGFSAPDIYAADLDTGLLLLEDLGSEPVIADGAPIPERYREAALLLAKLHGTTLPDVLPVADGIDHVIPPYDLEALLTEVELIIDWYAPHIGGKALSAVARAQFNTLWTRLLADVVTGPSTWTLRDFHSPNLIWLPERQGLARLGVLDFQDTVLGHPAYDLAALLQDARVTVPAELELSLLGAYARARQGQDPDFDVGGFAAAYAVFAAQRGTKLFGTFARLAKRDGKSIYLNHLPRLRTYLVRNLAHPVLSELRLWYETHLPALVADT